MSTVLRRENWLSGFWIMCGLLICVASYRLSLGSLNDPGPGMFPFIAGAALCMLSAFEWLNARRAKRATTPAFAQKTESSLAGFKDRTALGATAEQVGTGTDDARANAAEAIEPLFANRIGALKAAAVIAALLLYALTMEHLGFILSTTLFIAFLLWLVERQRWYVIVFGAVLFSVATYLVFKVWLETALPIGWLGF